MKKKILSILITTLLIVTVLQITVAGNESGSAGMTALWQTIYENDFEENDWNESGAISGPDLWHITSVDAWSGENSLGCFSEGQHYVNNMFYNYIIGPTLNMEDVEGMIMDFYCKFITEDSDDHWGIAIYDPGTKSHLAHIWTASAAWRHLPYETYG